MLPRPRMQRRTAGDLHGRGLSVPARPRRLDPTIHRLQRRGGCDVGEGGGLLVLALTGPAATALQTALATSQRTAYALDRGRNCTCRRNRADRGGGGAGAPRRAAAARQRAVPACARAGGR